MNEVQWVRLLGQRRDQLKLTMYPEWPYIRWPYNRDRERKLTLYPESDPPNMYPHSYSNLFTGWPNPTKVFDHQRVIPDIWSICFHDPGYMVIGYMVIPHTWSILAGPDVDLITGTHCTWVYWWTLCSDNDKYSDVSDVQKNCLRDWSLSPMARYARDQPLLDSRRINDCDRYKRADNAA